MNAENTSNDLIPIMYLFIFGGAEFKSPLRQQPNLLILFAHRMICFRKLFHWNNCIRKGYNRITSYVIKVFEQGMWNTINLFK